MDIIQLFEYLMTTPVRGYAQVARTFPVSIGTGATFNVIVGNFVKFLAMASLSVCGAVFMIGTLFVVISRGKEDQLQKGKDLMVGALIGLGVIGGSYGILRTFFYAIYTL
jgi:hypothetical protein